MLDIGRDNMKTFKIADNRLLKIGKKYDSSIGDPIAHFLAHSPILVTHLLI